MKNPDNYYRSEKWKRKKKRVYKFKGKNCWRCGGKATQIHHRSYKNFGNEKDRELIPVCKKCHKEIHKQGVRL